MLLVAGAMLNRHDVNNALAEFAPHAGLKELSLGPDDVASAEFGDEGVVAICFDEACGCVRLLSPVGKLDASAPIARQAALLKAALSFNIENMSCLGMEFETGVFLLSLQLSVVDRFGEDISDFARQSIGIANWLDGFEHDVFENAEDNQPVVGDNPDTVVVKP